MLPLVGSVMMPPGRRRPCASASQIIRKATRSLILPPGLNISSLASTVAPTPDVMRFNSTRGVCPTSSVTSFAHRPIYLLIMLISLVARLESYRVVPPYEKVYVGAGLLAIPYGAVPNRTYR